MDGIINLLKEPGPTSHDMVVRLRKLLKIRRIGHAGTLDPGASGVLVIGVGRATRVLEYLQDESKTYVFEAVFGCSTTTYDAYGQVTAEGEGRITKESLETLLTQFTGPLKQIPPMASAIKVRGKKLYELMREGIEIERTPRDVTVYSLTIKHAPETIEKGSRVVFEAQVSSGTYVRSLCHDIGEETGLKAHMGFLLRTSSGGLKIEDSLSFDEIEQRMQQGLSFTEEMDRVLNFAEIVAGETSTKALFSGQSLARNDVASGFQGLKPDQKVKVYTHDRIFAGIYRFQDSNEPRLIPEKVFIS